MQHKQRWDWSLISSISSSLFQLDESELDDSRATPSQIIDVCSVWSLSPPLPLPLLLPSTQSISRFIRSFNCIHPLRVPSLFIQPFSLFFPLSFILPLPSPIMVHPSSCEYSSLLFPCWSIPVRYTVVFTQSSQDPIPSPCSFPHCAWPAL